MRPFSRVCCGPAMTVWLGLPMLPHWQDFPDRIFLVRFLRKCAFTEGSELQSDF